MSSPSLSSSLSSKLSFYNLHLQAAALSHCWSEDLNIGLPFPFRPVLHTSLLVGILSEITQVISHSISPHLQWHTLELFAIARYLLSVFSGIGAYPYFLPTLISLFLFFPFVRGEVLPATFSPPHLIVFSTLLYLLSSSSSSPASLTYLLTQSSHLSLGLHRLLLPSSLI